MSTLFVVLFYSSGMPILYLLAVVFFTFTYLANKLLFFNYYQKTDHSLSRDLPLYSLKILQIGVMLKLIVGVFMYADPEVWSSRQSNSNGGGGQALPEEMDLKNLLL
jgi:hypothetical protein